MDSNIRLGDAYKKHGSVWRVVDTTAGVITLRCRKHAVTLYPSELTYENGWVKSR